MSTYQTIWQLGLNNRMSGPLSQLSGQLQGVHSQVGGFTSKIGAAGNSVNTLAGRMPSLSGALGALVSPAGLAAAGLAAVGAAIYKTVGAAADYQDNIAELSAITGFAGNDLKYLHDRALEVGAASGLGANQAATAYKLLASNIDVAAMGGVKALDMLQEKTITLSKAAGVDLPMAADTMAATINQFQMKASDAGNVINVLAAGAKYGAAEIPDLAESLKNAGVAAHNAGLNIESAVGALEVLSQNAIKGGEAGTGLRNTIAILQQESAKAAARVQKALKEGKKAGDDDLLLSSIDLRSQGLAAALEKLKPKMSDAVFMADLFGRENLNVATALIQNAEAVDQMTVKVTGTNVAYDQAKVRSNTFNESVKKLKASVEGIAIRIGEFFIPILQKFFDWITKMVNGVSKFFKDLYNNSFVFRVLVDSISTFFEVLGMLWDDLAWKFEQLWFLMGKVFGRTDDFNKKAIAGYESAKESALRERQGLNMREAAEYRRNIERYNMGMFNKEEYLAAQKELTDKGKERLAQLEAEKRLQDQMSETETNSTSGSTGPIPESAIKNQAIDPETGLVYSAKDIPSSSAVKGAGVAGAISGVSSGISGKSDQIKTITVNIEKLVDQIVINPSSVKESAAQIKQAVTEALVGAVHDYEQAMG